jgi:hypothetical protein
MEDKLTIFDKMNDSK